MTPLEFRRFVLVGSGSWQIPLKSPDFTGTSAFCTDFIHKPGNLLPPPDVTQLFVMSQYFCGN